MLCIPNIFFDERDTLEVVKKYKGGNQFFTCFDSKDINHVEFVPTG